MNAINSIKLNNSNAVSFKSNHYKGQTVPAHVNPAYEAVLSPSFVEGEISFFPYIGQKLVDTLNTIFTPKLPKLTKEEIDTNEQLLRNAAKELIKIEQRLDYTA